MAACLRCSTSCGCQRHYGLVQSPRANTVLLWSVAIHMINIFHTLYQQTTLFYVYNGVAMGILLILYPLSGWLADVYFTRFNTMYAGLLCVILGTTISVVTSFVFQYLVLLGFTVSAVGYALFEVNAIQFGLDQLQVHSTENQRSFVYWYFFTTQLGHTFYGLTQCGITLATAHREGSILITNAVFGGTQVLLLLTIAVLVCIWKSRYFHHLTGFHPYKLIYQVLKAAFTMKHTATGRRTSLIERTKSQYGGPFSATQVNDVKLFFYILGLLFPLSAYHYVDEIHSIAQQFFNSSIEKSYDQCLLTDVPNWLLSALTTLLIPIYLLLVSPFLQQGCYRSFGLLWTMGIGLSFCFLSIAGLFGIELKVALTLVNSPNMTVESNLTNCPASHILDFHWLLIPELFNSLSYIIVFSTALEFICAQAPLNMRGLLIGVWYSFTGLDILIVTLQNYLQLDCYPGYHIAKVVIVFGCLLLFIVMAYKYRNYNIQKPTLQQEECSPWMNSDNKIDFDESTSIQGSYAPTSSLMSYQVLKQ